MQGERAWENESGRGGGVTTGGLRGGGGGHPAAAGQPPHGAPARGGGRAWPTVAPEAMVVQTRPKSQENGPLKLKEKNIAPDSVAQRSRHHHFEAFIEI